VKLTPDIPRLPTSSMVELYLHTHIEFMADS
jgi:hypothetical protein